MLLTYLVWELTFVFCLLGYQIHATNNVDTVKDSVTALRLFVSKKHMITVSEIHIHGILLVYSENYQLHHHIQVAFVFIYADQDGNEAIQAENM